MNNANTDTNIPASDPADPAGRVTLSIHPRVVLGALVTAITLTVGIGAASFWLSFGALRELAVMAGTEAGRAWVIPVVLDGIIVATTVTAIALAHHRDPRTVRGRRFVLTVLTLDAGASIAGNAYHATLTSALLPSIVAAGIATIAPVSLLAMTEVMAVILRAPQGREPSDPVAVTASEDTQSVSVALPDAQVQPRERLSFVDEDLDNGRLKTAVWTSVALYLEHPEWSLSDIARHLDIATSTVSRHIKTWTVVQHSIATARSITPLAADTEHADLRDRNIGGGDDAGSEHDHGPGLGRNNVDNHDTVTDTANREYAVATR